MEKFQLPPEYDTEELRKLVELFPQFWKESYFDFEEMKSYVSGIVPDDLQEKYSFTWHGKTESYRLLKKNSNGTLRPCKEESVNWDTTQNLYIEGDNLEVLKLIKHTYAGERGIKMIYIDPPYNTGKDFIYDDDFIDSLDKYLEYTNQKGIAMPEASGRYHTKWLNMMYPRLWLANYLLRDDGVIFISIDDNEVHNLRKLCDEVFGEENFVAQLVWEKKKKGSFLSNSITNIKEYILVYCKSLPKFKGLIGEINTNIETYPCVNASNKREIRIIPIGIKSKYKEKNYFLAAGSEISDTTMSIILHSDLVIKDGILAQELVVEGNWRYSQSAMTEYALKKELYITRDLYLRRIVTDAREKTLKDILP